MLTEIAAYVVAEGLGTLGTDLFLGTLPDQPDAATAMLEVPGLATRRDFDGVLWEAPRVRVLCRAATYLAARQQAEAMRQALLNLRGQALESAIYINTETSPVALYDRDATARPVCGFTAEFTKRLSP